MVDGEWKDKESICHNDATKYCIYLQGVSVIECGWYYYIWYNPNPNNYLMGYVSLLLGSKIKSCWIDLESTPTVDMLYLTPFQVFSSQYIMCQKCSSSLIVFVCFLPRPSVLMTNLTVMEQTLTIIFSFYFSLSYLLILSKHVLI